MSSLQRLFLLVTASLVIPGEQRNAVAMEVASLLSDDLCLFAF
jgi:hypothetical protein